MLIFVFITIIIILLYLAYPIFLLLSGRYKFGGEVETEEITGVSMILITYNGRNYLNEKIIFLLKELMQFSNYELIIIDDNSTDGTQELIDTFAGHPHVIINKKSERKGIVHSMNMGVMQAKYDHLVFCDQRQCLSENILRKIVDPLRYRNIGAVSGLISSKDKGNRRSLIRTHENFIKLCESRTGDLIGTYGPLYAVRKSCYTGIPENIILDDLYLSLHILSTHKIVLLKDCCIVDENFSSLYNYSRAKRYLMGLLQLLKQKGLIKALKNKQRLMLYWHKYLRLIIPVCLFISYIFIGLLMPHGPIFVIFFGIVTLLLLIIILSLIVWIPDRLKSVARLNVIYFVAFFDVLFMSMLRRKKSKNTDATGLYKLQ